MALSNCIREVVANFLILNDIAIRMMHLDVETLANGAKCSEPELSVVNLC